jgi:hypothetical protein
MSDDEPDLRMPRPAFDLGLWAVCTAVPFAVFGGLVALDAWDFGSNGSIAGRLTGVAALSLFTGWVFYDGGRRVGWRVSRPRPDQAEDYGDGDR